MTARLAQSVEHETLNLGVVGSSPTLGEHFSCMDPFVKFRVCERLPCGTGIEKLGQYQETKMVL